ncbi:MAG: rod shape-determining protein MreD, partial [Candidatus Rokubacteria bacterium]|nr:rod shape-determining protein MreD [Candidatus Rokubacteria bacterium]
MKLGLLLMTLGGTVAQTSVVQALSVGGATPDLPFVITVFLALRRGPEAGCVAGF